MSLIGCARISTAEGAQLLDRRLGALRAASCERGFEGRASGAKADRPGLTACLDHLRRGDVLVVLDLDRPGRLATELVGLVDELAARGVAFKARVIAEAWQTHRHHNAAFTAELRALPHPTT